MERLFFLVLIEIIKTTAMIRTEDDHGDTTPYYG